ncbi:hypothetical protein A3A84_02605 [Candidatus Collierbacteria bacterium RIFCSPLOWO2_01_FULL_50_23]|uniref:Penicillin-binding protein 2 n=1 Tax=Candidatus Collierbacteria bacterium RIFCSPHIGHO2_01_FULL_50_25 TaxID=1817722 RepID=A0A1F5EYE8_9BACT|nr:MAG: hypothetical protein A2703_04175 [Candidatus Collierbacteria bacterium RIFCSPHIGHO2_01_FULL_50_25]OGD75140.1 MAG: hypothetical protein A3A84_02605 [Candidatus Collierbacteria bacterium RIFCSPLOWO2_01_FULL_50_23]
MNKLFRIGLVLIFAVFLSRSFFITVLQHSYYEALANDNQVKTEVVTAPRGTISDRNGKLVATNILVDGKTVRHYPDGEMVASVVGYVSDGVGVAGLEKQYQDRLRGKDGERVVEETASGKEVKEVASKAAQPGGELRLNLDMGLQTSAYRALKERLVITGKAGAVVISKVNGELLSLVSLPSYDPNLFYANGKRGIEGGVYSDAKNVIADEVRQPMFNRAIGGTFPPGSVFKVVPALAGLSEGVIGESDLLEDSGEIKVGIYRFGNWLFDKYGRTEGWITVTKALARSNDIFFYRLGEKIGIDKLAEYSKMLGLGTKTGIDLPGESPGLLPTPLWMEKEKGTRWFLGDTYHVSIGQGDLLVTPLQINRVFAEVVSGKKCAPRLFGKSDCEELPITEKARKTVMDGMKMACESGGTGFPFFDLKGAVYCKTGTAQHGGEEAKPHAWISVVVPKGNIAEWVVITVMLDEAGEGSEQAGPVARRIVDYLLNRDDR